MDKTDALKHVLQDISVTFNEKNERYEVQLTEGYSGLEDEQKIAVDTALDRYIDEDLDGANELRLLVDDMAYNIWRTETDHRQNVKPFMTERKEAPHLAGAIRELIEQQYLNATRVDEYQGLRKTLAFRNDLLMANAVRVPPAKLKTDEAYVESFIQLALAGYVKEFDDIEDDELREFIFWARKRLAEARTTEEKDERDAIADEVYSYIIGQTEKRTVENRARNVPIPIEQLPHVAPRWSGIRFKIRENYRRIRKAIQNMYARFRDRLSDTYETTQTDDTEMENRSWDRIEEFVRKVANLPVIKQIVTAAKFLLSSLLMILVTIYKKLRLDILFGWLRRLFERLSKLFPDLIKLPFSGSSDGDQDADEQRDADDDADATDPSFDEPDIEDIVLISDDTDVEENAEQQMELMEERERAGDWFNLDSDIEYWEASDSFEERYQALNNDSLHVVPSIDELEDLRDGRLNRKPDRADRFAAEMQAQLAETELDTKIEDAFKQLTTRDRNVQSRHGRKLDMHAVQRRMSGDKSVDKLYTRRKRAEVGRRAVVVALDASGSMDMTEANLALKALQHATETIGDEFLAISFNGDRVNLITGPNESYDDRHLAAVSSGGGTPVARGVVGARKLLQDATYREALMVVITDGGPNKTLPRHVSAGSPVDDVTEEVHKARSDGIPVIGLAAGGDITEETMVEMFGEGNVVHAQMDDLADQLVNIYQDQLRFAGRP